MAQWNGEWYARRYKHKDATWRNRRTGAVSSTPRGSRVPKEITHFHTYGRDSSAKLTKMKLLIPKAAKKS